MVDIKKLRGETTGTAPTDPLRIFKRQPKPPGVNDLWDSQADVLRVWHDKHRRAKDVVVKLNTGGGKTLVGLLMAQSLMNELGRGALYLCANNQLVEQTVEKAREFQLHAVPYANKPLAADFLNGEAILVASYRALFHGYSRFGVARRDVPVPTSAIICDDAHTAFSDLRSAFSILVSKGKLPGLYHELTSRFRAAADQVGKLGTYDQMVGGRELGVFEVPYWVWKQLAPGVRELLSQHDNKQAEYHYQLPLLLDALDCCHALVTNTTVTITSFLPLVNMLPTFTECPHRIYMSATIADDSSLIRTFDADSAAVKTPLAPESLAGVGERMIIAPALTPVGEKDEFKVAKSICQGAVKSGVGVVVLVPSKRRSERWEKVATLQMEDEVAAAVARLTDRASGDNGPYVFANRYDGIDLPGDACRILVLDGLPQGANVYDEYRATVLRGSSQIELSLAQRVEQGLGRGTRGAGDYCVVLLLGDLVDWLSRRDNLNLMTAATRVQLSLGIKVSKAVVGLKDLHDTVDQCLKRDPDWVAYHAQELAENVEMPIQSESAIATALAERAFLAHCQKGEYEQAAHVVRTASEQHGVDPLMRGWLLQFAARANHYRGHVEDARHQQSEAATLNYHLHFPPGVHVDGTLPEVGRQAKNVAALIDEYSNRQAFLKAVNDRLLPLSGSTRASQFEEAMRWLGTYLGFSSERLDRGGGKGPDNVWRTGDGRIFVISCKNEKQPDGPLWKKDVEQLLIDTKWVEEHYSGVTTIPIVVMPSVWAAEGVPTSGLWVMTLKALRRLVGSLNAVLADLANSMRERHGLEARAAKLLDENNLTPDGIAEQFVDRFRMKPKGASRA